MEYLMGLEKVKSVAKASTDEEAAGKLAAAVEMIEAYIGMSLIKQNHADEKITLPYPNQRILRPRFAPINSVSAIKFLKTDGSYDDAKGPFSIGKFSIEVWGSAHPRAGVAAAKVTYNAGLYDGWDDVPALIKLAAEKLLAWLADDNAAGVYASENFGSYSYSKGQLVRGLPETVASLLDGVRV